MDDAVLLVIPTVAHCIAISQHVGLTVDCFPSNMSVTSAVAANLTKSGPSSNVPRSITHKTVMCDAG